MMTATPRLRVYATILIPTILMFGVPPLEAAEDEAAATVGEPSQIVDALHETLLQVMRNAATLGLASSLPTHDPVKPAPEPKPVDVAICLDTSGSMKGLINAARQP